MIYSYNIPDEQTVSIYLQEVYKSVYMVYGMRNTVYVYAYTHNTQYMAYGMIWQDVLEIVPCDMM